MAATPLDQFQKKCEQILQEYGDEVTELTKELADSIGKTAANTIKANAKSKLKTTKYYKGWTYTAKHTRLGADGWVHNKTDYQLTHLLEKGHVTRNGTGRTFGRTPAYPHIKEVEDWVVEQFERQLKLKVSK